MEIREITDKTEWEDFVGRQAESSLLQSWQWKEFSELEGSQTINLFVVKDSEVIAAALLLKIGLPGGRYYLYAPRGPIFKNDIVVADKEAAIKALCESVKEKSDYSEALFVRFDPALAPGDIDPSRAGLCKASKEVQPRHTSIVDVSVPEEEVIRNMKSSARQSIKSAEKKGAVVVLGRGEEDIKRFYQLLASTATRSGFFIYPESHYINLWRALTPDNIRLYLAEAEGELAAGIMVVVYGTKAIYLHAASDYAKRQYLAPYLLQLQAIRDMQKSGVTSYDLWGVAREGAGKDDPWYGITFFKKGLGGNYVEYLGTYDYVLRPLSYSLFNIARTAARKLRGR